MTQLVSLIHIRWIVIYPVDSAIQGLNNQGLVRLKFPVPFGQIVVSENDLSVSCSQYH